MERSNQTGLVDYVEGQERIIGSRHPEIIKASQQLVGYLDASGERTAARNILGAISSVTFVEDDKGAMISGSKIGRRKASNAQIIKPRPRHSVELAMQRFPPKWPLRDESPN